jgi:hypothetical protein
LPTLSSQLRQPRGRSSLLTVRRCPSLSCTCPKANKHEQNQCGFLGTFQALDTLPLTVIQTPFLLLLKANPRHMWVWLHCRGEVVRLCGGCVHGTLPPQHLSPTQDTMLGFDSERHVSFPTRRGRGCGRGWILTYESHAEMTALLQLWFLLHSWQKSPFEAKRGFSCVTHWPLFFRSFLQGSQRL